MNKVTRGWAYGILGVLIFSGSLPATRLAVKAFDPLFLTAARGAIAGVLAAGVLMAGKTQRPSKVDAKALAMVSLGVVIGFPLLSALALSHISAAHALVYVGLLPLATASFALWRGAERPKASFWLFSLLGGAVVVAFGRTQATGTCGLGDSLMLAAIVVCGLGYAEGARLARTMGGVAVIAWALVMALPATLGSALMMMPPSFSGVAASAWMGLAYVSVFSMLIGFVFWYRGLALGGIAAVGQLQLLQPFFGLALSACVLHEHVTMWMLLMALAVMSCVGAARKFA